MEKAKYNQFLQDDSVIKYDGWSGGHFISGNKKHVVSVFFFHTGFPVNYSSKPEKRILLSIIPSQKIILDIPIRSMGNSFLILVNSDEPNYAMTFRINIDEGKSLVSAILEDYPILGEILITDEEKNGSTKGITS